MADLPEEASCWLPCGSSPGIGIREDVGAAASKIWRIACKKTRVAMGDSTEIGGLMEAAAARASRFLDRLDKDAVSANTRAVLLKIFCRLLRQRAVRFRRLEPIGQNVEIKATAPNWEDEMNMLLFFEKLQGCLPPESVTILGLRRDGHVWEEIAAIFETSVPAVKKRFWRDIENAKVTLRISPQAKPAGRAKVGQRNKAKGSSA
jgi:hypothetical protein